MAEIAAWACATTDDDQFVTYGWEATLYLGAVPLGQSLVGITNWADVPVKVLSVCRSDYGRDFRDLPEPLVISPERTAWVDLDTLPARWPVTDPDLDYKLVATFSMWTDDGVNWRFGTPEEDLGPVIVRPALHDRMSRKYS